MSSKAARLFSRALSVKEAGGKHVPWGTVGTGTYTAATKGCFDVIGQCEAEVKVAVDKSLAARRAAGAVGTSPYAIADFGTADAGTSLPLLRSVVSAVRAAEPSTPIVVHYEDQAMNDWQSVFRLVHGDIPDGPATYMDGSFDDVYVLASGSSFYQRCFPPGSIDLGFCATAMHWLTSTPTPIPDALHSACTADGAAQRAFSERAAKDWEHILLQRAHELKPGGQLVIANFAVDDEGQFLGTSGRVSHSMHHTFSELWAEVAGDEVHAATNFPNQYRSLEACVLPLESAGGAVGAAGLRLSSARTALVPCPFRDEWVRGEVADAAEQARRFVPTTRTWSNSTFVSGATSCGIEPAEAAVMVDEMFARYEAKVALDPANHAMDYVHSYLHIEKHA